MIAKSSNSQNMGFCQNFEYYNYAVVTILVVKRKNKIICFEILTKIIIFCAFCNILDISNGYSFFAY